MDDFFSVTIWSDPEWVAPLRPATDIDGSRGGTVSVFVQNLGQLFTLSHIEHASLQEPLASLFVCFI